MSNTCVHIERWMCAYHRVARWIDYLGRMKSVHASSRIYMCNDLQASKMVDNNEFFTSNCDYASILVYSTWRTSISLVNRTRSPTQIRTTNKWTHQSSLQSLGTNRRSCLPVAHAPRWATDAAQTILSFDDELAHEGMSLLSTLWVMGLRFCDLEGAQPFDSYDSSNMKMHRLFSSPRRNHHRRSWWVLKLLAGL